MRQEIPTLIALSVKTRRALLNAQVSVSSPDGWQVR